MTALEESVRKVTLDEYFDEMRKHLGETCRETVLGLGLHNIVSFNDGTQIQLRDDWPRVDAAKLPQERYDLVPHSSQALHGDPKYPYTLTCVVGKSDIKGAEGPPSMPGEYGPITIDGVPSCQFCRQPWFNIPNNPYRHRCEQLDRAERETIESFNRARDEWNKNHPNCRI
jgi:hypothetical protein